MHCVALAKQKQRVPYEALKEVLALVQPGTAPAKAEDPTAVKPAKPAERKVYEKDLIPPPAAAGESIATVIIFFLFINLSLLLNFLKYLRTLEMMY